MTNSRRSREKLFKLNSGRQNKACEEGGSLAGCLA